MVLGLGSRSKKDRSSTVTQLVELELFLHEIKPWQGLARPSNTPTVVSLRSTRGERVMGSSRNLTPMLGSGAEIGKIAVGEALRILVAPDREVLKKLKKSHPNLDNPLVFTLLEVSDPKGKPLGQAALELAAVASTTEPKLIAVPFSVSKKIAKGPMPYLHLTVQRHQEDKASGLSASASSAPSISSRTSDASSVPPLDEDTQQMLVAALLSDEEDKCDSKEAEIDSFTDDDEDSKDDNHVSKVRWASSLSQRDTISKATQERSLSQGNATNEGPLPQGNVTVESVAPIASNVHERPSNLLVHQKVEKQEPERVVENVSKQPQRLEESLFRQAKASPQLVASPQASPVKAAAIAAANAYAKKHSFLARDTTSYMDDSDDPYSDLDSDGEHEFQPRPSRVVRPPSVLPKGPQTAGRSPLTFISMKSSESVTNVPTDVSITTAGANVVKPKEKVADSISQNSAVLDNTHTELNGEHKTLTKSVVSTAADVRAVRGKLGVAEETPELKGPVSLTTPENGRALSLTRDTSGSSSERRSVSETTGKINASDSSSLGQRFVPETTGNMQTSIDNIVSLQKADIVKSNAAVNSPGEAAMKQQSKTKLAVKSPLREKSSSGSQKISISKSPDPMKARTSQSPIQDGKLSTSSNQDEKAKVSKSSDRDTEKGDKKASEENRLRMPHADSKAGAAETRLQHLEAEVENLKGELREVAAVEAALYSTTAEHGRSSMKLHAPARRLARLYVHALKNWSQERRASCARNTMSGLILVARACGNDVPRLTFWWSNTTVLREILSSASNVLPASPNTGTMTRPSSLFEKQSSVNGKKLYQKHQSESPSRASGDWREPSTFTSALERLERWTFTKVVESIWWQVLTPQMQQPIKILPDADENDFDMRQDGVKDDKKLITSEIEDSRHGNISVEIWKKAFLDAFERLCPVRRLGVECGCLPMLNKLVLEACVVRLDVAMFNAILRDDEIPTDPVSDPISDIRVLPIPNSSLSFGLGAQLKNAVATLSSFLSNLASKDGENVLSAGYFEDDEKNVIMFPLLKAMGGLLMLPKDMLIDTSLRKEVCPTLDLRFIERILSKFQPDEFSPEPVTPELLQTFNAEIAAENRKQETDDSATTFKIASAPSVFYCRPPSNLVKHWIGDAAGTNSQMGRSNSSILRKGHTSDDEIDELESSISWLLVNTMGFSGSHGDNDDIKREPANSPKDVGGTNRRFMLLREVWNSG